MISLPVESNTENTTIASSFEKAKYFAIYDNNDVKIESNPIFQGLELIEWLNDKGINNIIIKTIEINPYNKLKNSRINIYHVEDENLTIDEIIEDFKQSNLELLNSDMILELVKKHELGNF